MKDIAHAQKDEETREIARSRAWRDATGAKEPETKARSWRAAIQSPDVSQCSVDTANSEKESVPLHHDGEKAEQEALLRIAKGDQELAVQLSKYLQKQVAERYTTAIALEQAAALVDKARAKLPSPEVAKRKQYVVTTDAMLEDILHRYVNGQSISRICKEDDSLPHYHVVVSKLNDGEWKGRYESARRQRADKMGEELTEATNELNRLVAVGASSEIVNAMKLHVNTLQWVMARMNPLGWGERQTVDLNATVTKKEADVDAALLALLAKAGAKPTDAE